MGAILAQTIVDDAKRLLQDTSNVVERWTEATLLSGLNQGQSVCVSIKPDAYTQTVTVDVNSLTRVSLPADALQLIDITRNMGSAGSTPGRVITEVEQRAMDMADPSWQSAAVSTSVIHFVKDPRNDKEFLVWPPVAGHVEVIHSALPADISAIGNAIKLDDIYAPALTAYVVYYGISQDMDAAANRELASTWYGQFTQLVTGKILAEDSILNG